jgi:hypothetical protein
MLCQYRASTGRQESQGAYPQLSDLGETKHAGRASASTSRGRTSTAQFTHDDSLIVDIDDLFSAPIGRELARSTPRTTER